jgi:3-oxoacyl-[acyl-carrier-protein] synthase-3
MTAVGSYLPANIVTNEALSSFVDTDDSWIRRRTGIAQRHLVADGETTADLAYHAAAKTLANAGLTGGDIDIIIIATTTPDNTFPSTATKLQHMIEAKGAIAFDIQAVCAGFVYALDIADAMLQSGRGRRALVVGAESFSKLLDWEDRTTCVLFGDGAGAVVLELADDAGDWVFVRRYFILMVPIVIFSMSMVGHQAMLRSVMCAWKAKKCFAMPLKSLHRLWMKP